MTNYEIVDNIFHNVSGLPYGTEKDGAWRVYLTAQRRPVVDCNPNGKWRIGDTVGTVPKGHNCIIEGFVVRNGKTVKRGKATLVPNGGKDINYILRGNDIG